MLNKLHLRSAGGNFATIRKYIEKYNLDNQRENQVYFFNYQTMNKSFYNELDNEDIDNNINFNKLNNTLFESDKYILIRKPYDITNDG